MYLGIDLGTSELKLLLLDERHRIVATTAQTLTVSRPQPLWSEQHPDQWWQALDVAMLRLAAGHPDALRAVRGIGLSGQMHGAVLLDEPGHVLRPAILWNDGRSSAECLALEAAVPQLRQITGNLAMPGFTAPKLLWVREHEPELFARIRKVLLPKDWLRLRLTGDAVSDMSDASGTLWLDVGQRTWSDPLIEASGLTRRQMPELVEGSCFAGSLSAVLAQRWGMQAGTPVAGGGGDNAASAVGIGVVGPGQGFISLGTSGVIFLGGNRFRPNPQRAVHAFCHALPGRWHQMSVMLSAASALRWVTRLLGQPDEGALLERVGALSPAQQLAAPLFLPYLAGERTPHNDAAAQGVLFGLTHDHDAAAIGYAVIEGVAFGLLDGWASLSEADPAGASVGDDVEVLSLIGGGARSPLWARLIASTLGVAIRTHRGGDAGGALGAARLAWLADGADEATVCVMPPIADEYPVDVDQADQLAGRAARFRSLYPALRDRFGVPAPGAA